MTKLREDIKVRINQIKTTLKRIFKNSAISDIVVNKGRIEVGNAYIAFDEQTENFSWSVGLKEHHANPFFVDYIEEDVYPHDDFEHALRLFIILIAEAIYDEIEI